MEANAEAEAERWHERPVSGPWDVVLEEVACGANGTTQLASTRRYTREEAGSERVALPYEVLVVWVTGGRGCRAFPGLIGCQKEGAQG